MTNQAQGTISDKSYNAILTADAAPKPEQGWGFPANAKKAHYFVKGRSLCGRWLFFGAVEDSRHNHPDNCTACAKRQSSIPGATRHA